MFFYGDLEEEVIMNLALGFEMDDENNKACKLKKSLHGPK